MLLLELCEVRLLCGDLLRQHALQGGEGTLTAGQVVEGTLCSCQDAENVRAVMSRIWAEMCTAWVLLLSQHATTNSRTQEEFKQPCT